VHQLAQPAPPTWVAPLLMSSGRRQGAESEGLRVTAKSLFVITTR
jgi:hypothetical protein